MKMTKKDALNAALTAMTAETYTYIREDGCRVDVSTDSAKQLIRGMIEQLSKVHPVTEEKKAAISAARKEKTAQARAELVAKVAPVLREVLTHTLQGLTAKEIYGEAASRLPADFTAAKVQNVLLREMKPELNVAEAKGKANVYTLKTVTD